jgi:hypothetical protein
MEKYYRKNIEDLKSFRSSITPTEKIVVESEEEKQHTLNKLTIITKELMDTYKIDCSKKIEQRIKEYISELQSSQNSYFIQIKEQIKTNSDNMYKVNIENINKLAKETENSISTKLGQINSEFLNELLETQKQISENLKKKYDVAILNSKEELKEFNENIQNSIKNCVPFFEFERLQKEFYESMTDNYKPVIQESEKILITFADTFDVHESMILESTGEISSSGKLIVQPASFMSKTICGTYNNSEFLDNNMYQNILLINFNNDLSIGDLITTSKINGFGQKQETDNVNCTTVGKLISKINWMNMIEFNGQHYQTGIGLCKLY